MYPLATPFPYLEIAAFVIAVIAFLLTVRFFIVSQKKLEGLLPEKPKKTFPPRIEIDRDGFLVPVWPRKAAAVKEQKADAETKREIKELRNVVRLQQQELTRARQQMELLKEAEEPDGAYEGDAVAEAEDAEAEHSAGDNFLIEELQTRIAQKDAEIKAMRQEAESQQKLHVPFDDVRVACEALQDQVQEMEQQDRQTAELFLTVDGLQQAVAQAEKTMHKKEERLWALTLENARLQEALNEAEDKLAEANGQRQQLTKRVRFLEEINSDMQQMSDAAHKLKTEVRRKAELESMLHLITEERDALLKRV